MKIGLVTKIDKDFMLIMTDTMTIERIKIKDNISVGQRVEYGVRDIYKGFRISSAKKLVALMVAVLVLLTSFVSFASRGDEDNVYASISIDINPSLEFDINKDMIVTTVRTFNNDADELSLDELVGLTIEEALSYVLIEAQAKGYMDQASKILVASTIYSNDEDKVQVQVDQFLSKHVDKYEFMYISQQETEKKVDKNKKQSIGRTYVEELTDEEKASESTVEELFVLISTEEEETDSVQSYQKEEVQDRTEEITDKVEEIKEEVQDKVEEKQEEAQEKVEEAQDKAEEAQDKTEEIKDEVQDKVEETQDEAQEKVEEAQDNAEEVKGEVQDKVEETQDEAQVKSEEAQDKTEEVKGEVQDKGEETQEEVQDKPQEVKEEVMNKAPEDIEVTPEKPVENNEQSQEKVVKEEKVVNDQKSTKF